MVTNASILNHLPPSPSFSVKMMRLIVCISLLLYVVSCSSDESTPSPTAGPGATPPSAVEGLKVDSYTANEVTLSWDDPTNAGTTDGITPATISDYIVKYTETAKSNFIKIDENSDGVRLTEEVGTNTTATVTDLSSNTSYSFLVVAINSANRVGSDEQITPVEQTTATGVPTPPSVVEGLKVDSYTDSEVTLSWDGPTNEGTTDGITPAILSGYIVKYKDKEMEATNGDFIVIDENSERVRLSAALTSTSTTAKVIGLDGNTDYTFLVVAVHSGDVFLLDMDAPFIKQTTVVSPPKNLKKLTCAKTTSVELTWEVSFGATSYKLYRDDTELESITNSYTDTGLTPGTMYTYKVRACKDTDCSGDSVSLTVTTFNDKNFKSIIDSKSIPANLTNYDQMSREIFSLYNSGASLVAKYVKKGGSGDESGSSFANAAGDPKTVVDGITNATADNVYVVLLTGGTYTPETMSMKNHVAIVGGVDECLDDSDTVTALDGEGTRSVFDNSGINRTALLYRVTVTDGKAADGGGMHNSSSSPSLTRVTFSGNTANNGGGGMYNFRSSPSLTQVTFSRNTAGVDGGGMHNSNSSPSLTQVTFSENTATDDGGGMYNRDSSPRLIGVAFSENTAEEGGGMYNNNSSPSLIGVTFSGNSAGSGGGGIYSFTSSPKLFGVTFTKNRANYGGGIYNDNEGEPGPFIINGIFWGNTARTSGPQFYFRNGDTFQENLQENLSIYNSIVEGDTGTLVSGRSYTGNIDGGGFVSTGGTDPVVISFSNITNADPELGALANNGGFVETHAIIKNDSPAVNEGLYVKRKGSTYYYGMEDDTGIVWYTKPDLSEPGTPPDGAEDLTVTDATGYTRTDRPDLGAYEYRDKQELYPQE